MKVIVLGGGAGGLYFAARLKTLDPSCDVQVIERNPVDAAYGFGVVFSEQTVNTLRAADPQTYEALQENATTWDEIEVRHRGRRVSTVGHNFWAITRRQLLVVLQERAHAAGVQVTYDREIRNLDELGDHDVLVAADGVNSFVRETYREHFGPRRRRARSNYIWLGATKAFASFSFIFEETEAGAFGAHVYPIGPDLSTFVVDAGDETLRRAGLGSAGELPPGESDAETIAYLQRVFAAHLDGERLVGNNSKWLKFEEMRNRSWHHGRVVLLGDAAHTAHPSVGSGTKMAMEDGIALAQCLTTHADAADALAEYERVRRPSVERIQEAAQAGSAWWDWFDTAMRAPDEQFVFHYLTRTPRVTRDELAKRDRRLVRETQRWWDEQHGGAATPLAAPCRLGPLELPNRIAVDAAPGAASDDAAAVLAEVAGAARWGAGLVVCEPGGPALATAIDAVHARTDAKVAARLLAGRPAPPALEQEGFDLLVVASPGDPGADGAQRRLLEEAIREAVASSPLPVVAELRVDASADAEPGAYIEVAAAVASAGACGLAAVSLPNAMSAEQRRWRLQHLCGLLRIATGLPLILVDGVESEDQAATALMSGRADVCCGGPRLGVPSWDLSAAR